jgi:hypothetical protein
LTRCHRILNAARRQDNTGLYRREPPRREEMNFPAYSVSIYEVSKLANHFL